MVQNQITVSLYCEAVRSAILVTAWFLAWLMDIYYTLVTVSRLGVPSSHDLRVTDHCRPDFSLERTGSLPTF